LEILKVLKMLKYACDSMSFLPVWWPKRETNTTLPECVEILSKLGYEGISLTRAWNEQIVAAYGTFERFQEHLKSNKMELASIYYPDLFHDKSRWPAIMENAEELASFLKECNCTNFVIGVPARKYVDWVTTDTEIANMAKCLNRIGYIAAKYGVKPTVHPHYEGTIEKRSEIDKLMSLTDPTFVGLCLDTAQSYVSGVDFADTLKTYQDRITLIHFKDAKEKGTRIGYHGRYYWEVGKRIWGYDMGTGKIDFPAIMRLLKEIGYNGWIIVEFDHPDSTPTPYESAKQYKEYIDNVLSEIYK
jgi:inosose dehydratase